MPVKVLPDVSDLERLSYELQHLGFRLVTDVEFRKNFVRLGLKAPRPRHGREVGFEFAANGLVVWVWTTWLARECQAREVDEGWVLIADGDEAVYFSHPLHRTKNFTQNLLRQAWLARWRVLHRPLCPKCKNFMDIVRGRGLKARYWRCDRRKAHTDQKPVSLDWDHGLPKKAKKFVEASRKRRERYEKERKAEGKTLHTALLKRRSWERKTK